MLLVKPINSFSGFAASKVKPILRSEKDPLYKEKMSTILSEFYLLNPKRNQEHAVCPHCKKVGGSHAMKRWHFDNCKKKD